MNEEIEVNIKDVSSTKGDFPCPKCGTIMTPDDNQEYDIIDKDVEDGFLISLLIKCRNCNTQIRITGL
jgi:hypothetical protein